MVAKKQASAALRKPAKKSRKEALAKARASKEVKRLGQVPEPVAASPSSSATPAADPVSTESGIPVKMYASKRKLDLMADFAPQPSAMSQRLLLLDLSCLTALFKPFSCKSCGGKLTVISDTRKAFVCQLKTVCLRCEEVLSKTMTSKILKGSSHYDINRRAVLSMLNVGLSSAGHTTFCETMGLEGLTEKSFASHVREIHQASDRLKTAVLNKAVKKVYEAHGKAEGGVLDIAVSYDGTWQKRGHTSKYGLGVVIERIN